MIVKPRHPECRDCKFFSSTSVSSRCLPCGAGEFFEEGIEERTPGIDELFKTFRIMSEFNYDGDD
jgi:hypothetical protein